MKEFFAKKIKSTTEFLLQNIFWAVLTSFVTVPVFLSWLLGKFNDFLLIIQKPTPLWIVILFILIILIYVHLKITKVKLAQGTPFKKFLFEDSGVKWKVTDRNDGSFSVSAIPYCKYHNTQFFKSPGGQYMCRESLVSECKSKILDEDEISLLRNIAESKADSIINNYVTKG